MIRTIKTGRIAVFVILFSSLLAASFSFGQVRASSTYAKPVPGGILLRFSAKYYDAAAGHNHTHHGIDITAQPNSRVTAAAAGKVVFAGYTPSGNCVSLRHEAGIKTTYLPLAQIIVGRGDSVKQGQTIGYAAGVGDASSLLSHLHMGAIFAGEYIDPEALFSAAYKTDFSKLIRRGDIPPDIETSAQTDSQRKLGLAPGSLMNVIWSGLEILGRAVWDGAASFLRTIVDTGSWLGLRLWMFIKSSGSFLVHQVNWLVKGGGSRFAKILGWSDKRVKSFSTMSGPAHSLTFRRSITAGSAGRGVSMFDPSGDAVEPDSRIFISLDKGGAALAVEIFDARANVIRHIEGWGQPVSGVFWSGDDDDGRVVGDGLYTIVLKGRGGALGAFLVEVRWHL